jgi:glucose dehydrogenase
MGQPVAAEGIWPSFGGNLANTNHAKEEVKISPENVGSLELNWTYDLGSISDVSGRAAMIDGTLYFPDSSGYMHAVNAKTGQQIWKKSFKTD